MHLVRRFLVLTAAVVTTGCLSSTTLVQVQPDGSGTIEQILLVNPQTARMMMGGLGADGASPPATFNEANLAHTAERLGPSVRLVSAEPMRQGVFEGSKALFAFDDITTLRLDQDTAMAGATSRLAPSRGESPLSFQFTRQPGGTSLLTVTFDESKADDEDDDAAGDGPEMFSDPQMLQMLKSMFAGFRMSVDIEVGGTIVRTNADHVSGPRVTLLELDLESLMTDEAVLTDLQSRMGADMSIAALRPFLKNVRGLKFNEPVVTIEFR